MATAQQVAEFRQANQGLVLLAQRDLTEFWASLNVGGAPDLVRDALLAFFPELLTAYGDTAAVLGADFYDMLREVPPSASSFRAVLAQPVPTAQADGAARWALGPLFLDEPNPAASLARLAGATQRLVLQPGRDSIFRSAASDPVRTAIARIPSGPKTCRFCIMLASRGATYASEETAQRRGKNQTQDKFHDDCDCVPTVIRTPSDYPEDYDLDLYKRLYAEGSGLGRDIPDPTE